MIKNLISSASRNLSIWTAISILAFILASCSFSNRIIKGKGDIKLKQTDFANLKGWDQDDHREALASFINSCNKFEVMGDSRPIGGQIGDIKVGDFRDVCEIADVIKGMSSRQAKNFFENWFTPFLVMSGNGNSSGLFTGYFEPELKGNRTKTEIYKYPVYARPQDLSSQPYYSRKEIESGALKGKNLEILYVDDKVDLLFMHIQGTGRVILPDGTTIKLDYAGKNNHQYKSIGGHMIENKIVDKNNMSYQALKNWLKNNPDKADDIINVNNSYIFFKISNNEYSTGGQGVPLTAERSLAIDSSILPYGYPIWVETKIGSKNGKINYNKLMITQDTGSAIKGTIRGDIFFGRGLEAEKKATQMNSYGNYYILLPANIADKFKR